MLAMLLGLTMLATLLGHEVGHAARPPLSLATLPGLRIRWGRLLAVGHLLDVGMGLCGLLMCHPVHCPVRPAAPSAMTLGALLLGGWLPEMSIRCTVLIASGQQARSSVAAQARLEVVQELT